MDDDTYKRLLVTGRDQMIKMCDYAKRFDSGNFAIELQVLLHNAYREGIHQSMPQSKTAASLLRGFNFRKPVGKMHTEN
jgi:hypothetical protein